MSMTKQTYSAPTLTYYGKLAELTQAQVGSTLVQADATFDAVPDEFLDTDNDGKTDLIRVQKFDSSTTEFTASFVGLGANFGTAPTRLYDTNNDGLVDLTMGDINGDDREDLIVIKDPIVWDSRDGVDNLP